ncbi:hypothetical protein EDD86DRAFT_192392 [Gorgonomyces haynaldii]|nr:hypothetical protein EDD86DRAFT_192392 [Gorgonomyces haynaldii]
MLSSTFFRASEVSEPRVSQPFRKSVDGPKEFEQEIQEEESDLRIQFNAPDSWLPSPFLESQIVFTGQPDPERELKRVWNRTKRIYSKSLPRLKSHSLSLNRQELPPDFTEIYASLRHSRSFSSALNLDLNAASLKHIEQMMDQLLDASGIPDGRHWKEVMMKMLLKICTELKPDVRQGDEIDVRHYVKIKRIAGGKYSDSFYVQGIVATKSPLHKKMLKPIQNPNILILTFPLQYQRVESEFTSLEPLIAQEREHVVNLCARLHALKPDLILVQKSVSRIALDYFLEHNLTVVQNVKISLLEAIARCTNADIIHSIDKLVLSPKMGTCKRFSFKTFMNPELSKKTFMVIEGANQEMGCTIVLRGGSDPVLKQLKQIVDLMVFVSYNLKLETCLLQDQYAQTPNIQQEEREKLSVIKSTETDPIQRALRIFRNTIISASPDVFYPLPFLLAKLKEDDTIQNILENADATDNKPSLESRYILATADAISPFTQQNIMVLSANICKGNTIPCIAPAPHFIEFYGDSDLALGQFIEDTVYGSSLNCPVKTCEKFMLHHYRTYAHNNSRITITVDSLHCPVKGMEDRIMMWSLCKTCQESTPFIPMSEETWKYSFGKYLELTFYHPHVLPRAMSCKHDIHTSHIRFFSLSNLTVRIELEKIQMFELCVPPMKRQPKPELLQIQRQEDMNMIREQIVQFYDSVVGRIQSFVYEILPTAKQQQAREDFGEMAKRAGSEKKLMLQLLQQTFISSQATDLLSLNTAYKALLEKVSLWEAEFAEFVRKNLQSESRDIRKTAAQLTRIFREEPKQQTPKEDLSLEKSEFPHIGQSPSVLKDEEPAVDAIQRRLSVQLMETEDFRYPTVNESPSLASPAVSQQYEDFMYPREFENKDHSDDEGGINAITGVTAGQMQPQVETPSAGERTSLMQTISNLWTGNTANFQPLVYPTTGKEHIFPDSNIVVREDEPSSIISFTLSSRHYKEKLQSMRSDEVQEPTVDDNHRYSIDFDDQFDNIEETLLKGTGTHVRYQFWDGNTRIHCKVFYAQQFDALRRNCGVNDVFEQSLARCVKWDATGGKSGSYFMKTKDNWLVVKQLNRLEMDALYKFAPAYFEYMSQAFFHELPTVLAKIFGFYRIGFKNPSTGKNMKMDLLVMENLFYERTISRIFDLKGSMRNRHVQSTGNDNQVLLDENLVEFIYESPLFIREHSKKILRASVWNDTLFLSKLNVMDYSLLVGIDRDTNELVIGIVDFIRTFTWDKKLESWVKETGFLGGGGKEPTIVTPRQYKNRFRDSMDKYFLLVPDKFADPSMIKKG